MGRAGVRAGGRAGVLVLLMLLGAGSVAGAQQVPPPADTTRRDSNLVQIPAPKPQRPVRGDSIRPRPPVRPGYAFLRSLVLPGWGQASLHRNVTGGVFVAFEGIAVAMVWKSYWQYDYARTRNLFVGGKKQQAQDWTVLLAFNHVFSAAEAFVSAHLYDFPAALDMRTMPDGSTGIGVRVRF